MRRTIEGSADSPEAVACGAAIASHSPLVGDGRGGGSGSYGTAGPLCTPPTQERHPLPSQQEGEGEITVAGVTLVADLAGALYWPDEQLLVVSDLHLEKGSSFATHGILLPPYDTSSTLERLAGVLSRHATRTVIALGDNFHDQGGPGRLAADNRAKLFDLQRGRDWVWIAGNHDPDPSDRIGGVFASSVVLGPLLFCHQPTRQASPGEIAGHLHPVARIHRRGHTLTRRCFVSDETRLVMPAFGAYAGGLNIRHAAFVPVFGALTFTAHLLGKRRLYAFAAQRCLPDSCS